MIAKLALIAIMIGLALVNRFVVAPRASLKLGLF